MKYSIIIPTRNEEKNIYEFLKRLSKINPKPDEVIISDYSTDKTKEVAKKAFFDFKLNGKIIEAKRKGKGAGIKEGLKFATNEIIILIDADLNYLPEDIPKLLKLKNCDIVQPKRIRKDVFIRKLLGFLFHLFVLLLFNLNYDTQCALKLVRKKVFKEIEFKENGFAWDVEFLYLAKKKGFKICSNVKVFYTSKRERGKSKINVLTPFKMLFQIFKIRLRTL